MKRKISFVAAFILLLCLTVCFGMSVSAALVVDVGNCGEENGENAKWTLYDDGTIVISGQGEMCSYFDGVEEGEEEFECPWYEYMKDIEYVVIDEGIESIGVYAFEFGENIKTVKIAQSVKQINFGAFLECTSIETVVYNGTQEQWNQISFEDYNEYLINADIQFDASEPNIVETGSCGAEGDNVTFILYDNGLLDISGNGEVKSYNDSNDSSPFKDNLSILSIVFEEGITKISTGIFSGCSNIESVTLPDTLISIYPTAFEDCVKLKSIHLPKGLETIYGHFYEVESLEEITVDENNNYFSDDNGVLYNKSKTTIIAYPVSKTLKSYEILNGVRTIDYGCFQNDCIESIILPETITYINQYAVYGCSKIKNIYIPKNVIWISEENFYECDSLERFEVSVENTNYSTDEENVLYNKDKTEVIKYPEAKDNITYKVADTVNVIDVACFYYCTNLKNVILPEQLIVIEDRAFSGCKKLENVDLPKSVTELGQSAFSGCYNLNSINLHEGITSIGYSAFSYCIALTEVSLPSTLNTISGITITLVSGVFQGCENIRRVVFAEGTTKILETICAGLTSLEEVEIPDSVTEIESYAFRDCERLKSVVLPEGIVKVGSWAFKNCKSLTEIVIPSTLESAPNYLGWPAFEGCSNLRKVSFSKGTTNIIANICSKITNLETINIPYTVSAIGSNAFYQCNNIKEINVYNKDFEFTGSFPKNGVIKGFANSTAQTYAEANERAFEPLFGGLTYEYEEGVLTFTGPGEIPSIEDASNYPWSQYADSTYEIILNGVTAVGTNAFADFSKLRTVIIDGDFVDVQSGAFSGCTDLSIVVAYANINYASDAITGNSRSIKYFSESSKISNVPAVPFSFGNLGAEVAGEVSLTKDEFLSFVAAVYYGFESDFYTIHFNKLIADGFNIYKYTSLEPFEAEAVTEITNADVSIIIQMDENAYMQFSMRDFCEGMVDSGEEAEINYEIAVVSEEEKGFFETIREVFATWLEAIKKAISMLFKVFRK